MSQPLTSQHCVPCEGGTLPLTPEATKILLPQVPGWELSENTRSIRHHFVFKDFKESMRFINRVAELAEAEGHHPDIHCFWNKVTLELSTHAIKGLSSNDFIVAAKINTL
jgi:4a-hydroxytetrahydrobiopterin dehydratase